MKMYIGIILSLLGGVKGGAAMFLIVVDFFCPPIGVIDKSVLTAVGLLLMFNVVEQIPKAMEAGRNIRVQKGDFKAEIDAS